MDIKSAIEKVFAEYGVTAHWDLALASTTSDLTVDGIDGISDYELGVLIGVALAKAGLDDELLPEAIAGKRVRSWLLLPFDSAEHNPKRRRPMPSVGEYVTVELNGGSRVHGEVSDHFEDGDGFELAAGHDRLNIDLVDVKAWQS